MRGARSASKRFKLRPESESLAANQSATLKLRLPKRASKLVGRAQRKGKKAIANVTVTATDATGPGPARVVGSLVDLPATLSAQVALEVAALHRTTVSSTASAASDSGSGLRSS